MKKTAILIVLYNKEIHESTTIETLLKLGLSGVKIVIHNNGPREISMTHEQVQRFQMNCIDLEFINCTDNQPLSVVYNNFIKKIHSMRFFQYLMTTQISHLIML